MKHPVFMKLIVLFAFTLLTVYANAAIFYVDPSSTSSTANGSLANPWKTLAQVNSNMSQFNPGDQILFRKGQSFTGTLSITRSGTAGNPITFGTYGTGTDPLFWGTGATVSSLIYMNNRSYITFYGINISDTTISETDRTVQSRIQRAFYIDGSSNNVIIRKCRIDRVGVGAYIVGPNNTIDSCDVGNMRMVRNTPVSVNPDDDYGANPVVISSANNKITYNYFHDCWALSYDYGYDGGAIEFYGNGSSNNYVAYNTFFDCNGVAEHGSSNGGNIDNNVFAYNKMVNNSSLFFINNSGNFAVNVTNLQFYNNVIVENIVGRLNESYMCALRVSSTTPGIVVMKNNIFWLTNGIDVCRSNQFTGAQLVHEDNIFKLGTGSILNFTAHSTELVTTSSTIFANSSSADPLVWDFKPHTSSPAIDFGQTVGFTVDFVGNPVPAANAPDAGIIEAPATGALQAASSATTIACNGGTATVTVTASGGTPPYSGTGTFTVSAGTFSYTVRDANNASANTSVIVSQPAALTATVSTGTILVNGGTTTATVTATGGTGTKTYSLNSGAYQSSNIFSSVPAGNHSITVRDANGCTFVRSFSITQPTAIVATSTAGTIACNGGSTTVTVAATGGVSPYSGTGSFTVNAGTYNYTVTDANGASVVTSVTVTQPSALSATVSTGTINVFGGSTTATATATGGTGTKTYSLNGGAFQSSNTFSAVVAGSHSITVRDANGCTFARSFTITQPAALAASATSGTITCNGGNTTVTVTATGGISPYSGTGTFTVTAGTYNYTVTDANGATASTSITVTQPTQVNGNVTTGTITVNGGTTTASVTSSGGSSPYTFSFNNGAFQSSNSFSGIPAGNHTMTIRDANGCTRVRSFTVTEPAVLSISATAGTIVCNGGSTTVTVSATGGLTPYSGTGTFTVTAGTRSFTVTDAGGATATTSVTVTQPSAVNGTVTTGTITVNGGTTTASVNANGGTSPYTYSLNNGTFQSSNTFNNIPAGNHTITIKDANGCTTVKNISLTQPSALTANTSATSISCNGGSTSITVSATGGTAPYSGTGTFSVSAGTYNYTITDAAGSTATTSITVTQPSAIAVAVSTGTITVFGGTTNVVVNANGGTGTYTYKLNGSAYQPSNSFNNVPAGNHSVTVMDANGCTSVKNFIITQPANNPLVVSANASAIACFGGSATVTVTATGGTSPYSGVGTFTVTAGSYTYTVVDANGTSSSANITVLQPSALSATATTGTITVNGTTTNATVTATGGTSPYSYSLNGGAFQSSNVISGIVAGNHVVTVKDANGCTVTRNISITQPTALVVSHTTGAAILCNGGNTTVTISATGGISPYTGTGTFTVGGGVRNFTVTDAGGASSSVQVTIQEPAVLNVNVTAEAIGIGETSTTAIINATGGTAPYSYSLNGGAFQSSNMFSGVTTGDHSVTVLDANGCTRSGAFSVTTALAQTFNISLVNKSNATCRGGNDGSIEVLAMGGAAPYTYSLNTNGRFTSSSIFKNLMTGSYRVYAKDAVGNVASLVVYVLDGRRRCNTLGLVGRIDLNAYPNPTSDRFTLTVDSDEDADVSIEVYNMQGVRIHQDKGNVNKSFSFGESFKSGTYIVRVIQGKEVQTLKVVKGK